MKNKPKKYSIKQKENLKSLVFIKKIIKEISDSTYDEYLLNLESQTKKDAMLNAINSMKNTIKSSFPLKKYNKYRYSLLSSSIALITSLVIGIIGWLNTDVLFTFNTIYPIFLLITLIML